MNNESNIITYILELENNVDITQILEESLEESLEEKPKLSKKIIANRKSAKKSRDKVKETIKNLLIENEVLRNKLSLYEK